MKEIKSASRRGFLKTACATTASLTCLAAAATSKAAEDAKPAGGKASQPFTLAMASYTLRKFNLEEALAITKRAGLDAICLKSFHLPLSSTPEQIAACVEKTKKAGIVLYGGGVIYLKNKEQVEQAFEYAKAARMTRIVAAPAPELLPLVNDKVRQYDIAVCIHNHGPGDRHFATPEAAYEKIKHLDKRVGLCHDVGHTARCGADPVAQTRNCADRLLDMHMKDVSEATAKGKSVPCGRGVIDIPALLRALIDVKYTGYLAFEYEQEPADPLPGVAESVGYVRGAIDAIG